MSEGVFVYTGKAPTVSVRDWVRLGHREDFRVIASGTTLAATAPRTSGDRAHLGDGHCRLVGQLVSAPIVITPTTVPATYVPTSAGRTSRRQR